MGSKGLTKKPWTYEVLVEALDGATQKPLGPRVDARWYGLRIAVYCDGQLIADVYPTHVVVRAKELDRVVQSKLNRLLVTYGYMLAMRNYEWVLVKEGISSRYRPDLMLTNPTTSNI